MKKIVFAVLAVVGLSACLKTNDIPPPSRVLVPITIVTAQLPDTVRSIDTVNALIRVTAPNQCYRFEGFDSHSSGERQYDIQAIGSKPNPALQQPPCEDVVYVKDTSFKFRLSYTGKYVLRFFNGQQLVSADTLIVK